MKREYPRYHYDEYVDVHDGRGPVYVGQGPIIEGQFRVISNDPIHAELMMIMFDEAAFDSSGHFLVTPADKRP